MITDGKPQEELDEEVIVDDEQPAAPATVDLDDAEDTEKEFKQLDNKKFAEMRVRNKELSREREELAQKVAQYEAQKQEYVQPAPQPMQYPQQQREQRVVNGQRIVVPQTKQEWDALARADWQTAVDLKAVVAAENVGRQIQEVAGTNRMMAESKQKVLAKHPELEDVSTQKSQIYLQVLQEHPEYLNMPRGPVYAMRDMEERYEEVTAKSPKAAPESVRQAKAVLSGGGRMPASQGRTVTLSKEELEFCKDNGISAQEFAKQRYELDARKKGAQL